MATTLSMTGIAAWEDHRARRMPLGTVLGCTPIPPFLVSKPVDAPQAPSRDAAVTRGNPLSDPAVTRWWLAHPQLIQQIIDELHPIQGCDLPVAVRPIPDAPPVLDFETARAWKFAREQAYKLSALYRNEYDWKTGTVTPKQPLRRAA